MRWSSRARRPFQGGWGVGVLGGDGNGDGEAVRGRLRRLMKSESMVGLGVVKVWSVVEGLGREEGRYIVGWVAEG